MGGPSNTINSQNQLAQSQTALAQQEQTQSQQQYQQSQTELQPYIAQETALSGGDRNAAIAAAAPTISTLTGGFNAAKENILSSVPAGAGRDVALANLETQKDTGISSAMAQQVQQAPANLAAVGSGQENFSLQQIGAALSGFTGAQTGYANVAQEQNQAKASQLGFLGSLAGSAGTAVSGTKLWGG